MRIPVWFLSLWDQNVAPVPVAEVSELQNGVDTSEHQPFP